MGPPPAFNGNRPRSNSGYSNVMGQGQGQGMGMVPNLDMQTTMNPTGNMNQCTCMNLLLQTTAYTFSRRLL